MYKHDLIAVKNNSATEEFKNKFIAMMSGSEGDEVKNSTEARVELFSSEIARYLNPDNSFLQYFKQDTRLASGGKTMTLPQGVGNPTVTKGKLNPETKANGDAANTGTVTVRRNTKKSYTIEYFGTDPQVINMPEMKELSYDQRQDVLMAHADAILNEIANFAIIEIAHDDNTQGYLFKSTGATRASEVLGTVTVKGIAKNDLHKAKALLKKQGVKGPFYALPTPEQESDLIKSLDINFLESGRDEMIRKGIIGMINGINILDSRQNDAWNANVLYDTETVPGAYTKIALGATADGTTDASGMPVWGSNYVWKADGEQKVYSDLSNPIYKGDIYSAEKAFGATRGRLDGKGVVVIVEDIQP